MKITLWIGDYSSDFRTSLTENILNHLKKNPLINIREVFYHGQIVFEYDYDEEITKSLIFGLLPSFEDEKSVDIDFEFERKGRNPEFGLLNDINMIYVGHCSLTKYRKHCSDIKVMKTITVESLITE